MATIGEDVAGTSVGYEGSIDEAQWAAIAAHLGSPYWVEGADDWRVTAVAAADRTVRIAAGAGGGHGVRDVSQAQATVQGAVVSSGSRWDTVVVRRDWQGNKTSFEIIEGGSSKQIAASREAEPGVKDDQPIALVQFTAGQQLPVQIIDLRCWHGNGGVVAASVEALEYLGAAVGSVVAVGESLWVRTVTAQGSPAWRRMAPRLRVRGVTRPFVGPVPPVVDTEFFVISDSPRLTISGSSDVTWTLPAGGFPNGILSVQATAVALGASGQSIVPVHATPWPPGALLTSTKSVVYFRIHRTDGSLMPRDNEVILTATAVGW